MRNESNSIAWRILTSSASTWSFTIAGVVVGVWGMYLSSVADKAQQSVDLADRKWAVTVRDLGSENQDHATRIAALESALEALRSQTDHVMRCAKASLIVRSNRSDDQVFVDGAAIGPSGPGRLEVCAGKLKVLVTKEGFAPYEAVVELRPGETQVVRADLQAVD